MIQKNIITHGMFILKSGMQSNIYVNLKNLIGYPQLMAGLCVQMYKQYLSGLADKVVLCGVPYGAIPISTTLSMIANIPQIFLRKEPKGYGMNRLIEGDTEIKQIVMVEDVVTTGASVLESCKILEQHGFNIHSIISIVYRGDDSTTTSLHTYPFNYLFHINELKEANIVRNPTCYTPKQQQLVQTIERKQSNLILAFDKSYPGAVHDLITLLHQIHSHIVGIKIHNEILSMTYVENMKFYHLCKELDIFVWEDRKFNDIGHTIQHQIKYYESIRDFISIVPTGGALSIPKETSLGIFILCEMSSKDNLFTPIITQSILTTIETNQECISAVICQSPELFQLSIPTIMPGIHLKKSTDELGQCWTDPSTLHDTPTFYVVGRAITNSSNPIEEINIYNEKLFRKNIH